MFSYVTGRGEFTVHIWILGPSEVCAVSWGKITFFIWILGLSEVCAFFYFKLPSSTQVHNPFRVKSGLWPLRCWQRKFGGKSKESMQPHLGKVCMHCLLPHCGDFFSWSGEVQACLGIYRIFHACLGFCDHSQWMQGGIFQPRTNKRCNTSELLVIFFLQIIFLLLSIHSFKTWILDTWILSREQTTRQSATR